MPDEKCTVSKKTLEILMADCKGKFGTTAHRQAGGKARRRKSSKKRKTRRKSSRKRRPRRKSSNKRRPRRKSSRKSSNKRKPRRKSSKKRKTQRARQADALLKNLLKMKPRNISDEHYYPQDQLNTRPIQQYL